MKTILFTEDNPDIRENMGEILELAGYRVLLASDGKEGVALALAEKPDLIVCDIMMPELDGYGVIHLLQKNPATQHIPFIFLTARAERAEVRKGMELGADDYITKPFSGTELLNAVEGRLKRAERAQAAAAPAAPAQEQDARSLQQVFADLQETHTYEKKQRIYTEGHRPFRLYHVVSGKVKIFRTNDEGKDLITTVLQAGEYFGYTALLERTAYQETAEAIEPAEIASITGEAFENLMAGNPAVMQQFIRRLAGDVQEKEARLLALAYNSLRRKVAQALLTLHQKYAPDEAAHQAGMKISRENLAAIAGTAKESLIRTLSDFRAEHLIEITGSHITILDARKLAAMAN